MALLIACENKDPQPWVSALKALAPELDLRVWPDVGDLKQITFVLSWQHPRGLMAKLPNLKVVSSMGAGIDHLAEDSQFPEHLPVVRLVDPNLVDEMFDYLSTQVSAFRHHQLCYKTQQSLQKWQPLAPLKPRSLVVGVMGLGQIGGQVAARFACEGYRVVGWSNSAKSIAGVKSFFGDNSLTAFLMQTDILINLLPLTAQTRAILCQTNLLKIKQGGFLINVGRGGHLVESDLLSLLETDKLSGACLDVFNQEPLPANHPFWSHPKITVTPHVSSLTDPESVAPQILENYRRCQAGEPLLNRVDLERGY